jgi:hypothetical protein
MVTAAKYGMNLPPVNYWTPYQPFIDLLKSAGGWSQQGAPTGTPILLDDGMPTAWPTGASMLYTMILPEQGVIYDVHYKSDGLVHFAVPGAEMIASVAGRYSFRCNSAVPNGVAFIIYQGSFPTDMHIVRQDERDAFLAGEKFSPRFVEETKGLLAFRTMDMTQTNGSPRTEMVLADTKGTYATSGVPLSVIIDLANKTNIAPWICLPHMISDAGVRSAFALLKAGLKPGLKPYIEYSNETWNWGFPQTQWLKDNGPMPGDNYYNAGYRAGKIAIIGREFGYQVMLMGQFGDALYRFPKMETGWAASGATDADLSAVGGATYTYGKTLTDPSATQALTYAANNDFVGVAKEGYDQVETFKQLHIDFANVAKKHKVPYIAYEGAQWHLNTYNQTLVAFYTRFQKDPISIGPIMANTDAFIAAGGLFQAAFNWSSPPGTGGNFGVHDLPIWPAMKERMAADQVVVTPPAEPKPTIDQLIAQAQALVVNLTKFKSG